MNTQYLKEFLVFSEELNWTVAADKLFTTRPTLVDHMRCLEAELECKLIASSQRQPRPELTPAGRRFTRTAKELLDHGDSTRVEYRELADNLLTMHVASSNLPWLETVLYKARRAIQERHPYKRIEVVPVSGARSSIEALDAGEKRHRRSWFQELSQ